jgi:uncharacterized protein (DUF1499 family)
MIRRRLIAAIILSGAVVVACAAKAPTDIGVVNGRLAPCPASPNCVSSQSDGQRHHIDPIAYRGEKAAARQTLMQVVMDMAGVRVVSETDDYLHLEFKSRIMGFVDDVEFYFLEAPVIHVRSASRIGYSDFGVNRNRMQTIRQRFHADWATP